MEKIIYVLYYYYPGEGQGEPVIAFADKSLAKLILNILSTHGSDSKTWRMETISFIDESISDTSAETIKAV